MWIILTTVETGKRIRINFDHVVYYGEALSGGTIIRYAFVPEENVSPWTRVRERADQIDHLIAFHSDGAIYSVVDTEGDDDGH